MATVRVDLTEDDVLEACRIYAVTRVLNEGRALSAEMSITVCNGKPTGTLNSATVWVETDRMARAAAKEG